MSLELLKDMKETNTCILSERSVSKNPVKNYRIPTARCFGRGKNYRDSKKVSGCKVLGKGTVNRQSMEEF